MPAADPEVRGRFEDVERALDRVDAPVGDVLTLADAVDRCRSSVDTASATVRVEAERTVRADPGRLRRLPENLLRNAVEHGSTGSRSAAGDSRPEVAETVITVGETDDGDGFYVADGPGIPPDARDRVLERGCTTTRDGTGLGLAIVAEIVRAHGWELTVAESVAGGACIEVGNVTVVD